MPDQQFHRCYRLRTRAEFARAYGRRVRASDHHLLLFGHPNDLPHPRLGLAVSRKVGGAVERNRWKRLLREAFRLSAAKLPPGIDLVAIPKCSEPPPLQELRRSIVCLARRLSKRLSPGSTEAPQ